MLSKAKHRMMIDFTLFSTNLDLIQAGCDPLALPQDDKRELVLLLF